MRFSFKYFLAGVSLVALTMPAWAGTEHTQALHLQQDLLSSGKHKFRPASMR